MIMRQYSASPLKLTHERSEKSISLGVEILYDFPRNTAQKTSLLQKRKPRNNSNKKDQKANI